jgi:vacuolar-type H+-ATPase subunit E/Vma4
MGGCKVQTTDGKLVYDNTFENRIEQLKPTLRLEVAKILFQKEESPNVS